jgi:hypothetical protein
MVTSFYHYDSPSLACLLHLFSCRRGTICDGADSAAEIVESSNSLSCWIFELVLVHGCVCCYVQHPALLPSRLESLRCKRWPAIDSLLNWCVSRFPWLRNGNGKDGTPFPDFRRLMTGPLLLVGHLVLRFPIPWNWVDNDV